MGSIFSIWFKRYLYFVLSCISDRHIRISWRWRQSLGSLIYPYFSDLIHCFVATLTCVRCGYSLPVIDLTITLTQVISVSSLVESHDASMQSTQTDISQSPRWSLPPLLPSRSHTHNYSLSLSLFVSLSIFLSLIPFFFLTYFQSLSVSPITVTLPKVLQRNWGPQWMSSTTLWRVPIFLKVYSFISLLWYMLPKVYSLPAV